MNNKFFLTLFCVFFVLPIYSQPNTVYDNPDEGKCRKITTAEHIEGIDRFKRYKQYMFNGDTAIIKKYLHETNNFIPIPYYFIDSIRPEDGFKKWEYNYIYPQGQYYISEKQTIYKNLYRFPKTEENLPDSVVLSKSCMAFAKLCAPSTCFFYMSAQKGDSVITINNSTSLSRFLGKMDNIFNVKLWLNFIYDRELSHKAKYKMVEDGFLIVSEQVNRGDLIDPYPQFKYVETFFFGFDKQFLRIKTDTIKQKIPFVKISPTFNYFFTGDNKAKENKYLYPVHNYYEKEEFITKLENKCYYDYPYSCFTKNVEDDIIVRFKVEPGERITKVWVTKGVNVDLNNMVKRSILEYGNWKAGQLNDKEVPVTVEMKIKFRLLNK